MFKDIGSSCRFLLVSSTGSFNCPCSLIIISQLSRSPTIRRTPIPYLFGLRGFVGVSSVQALPTSTLRTGRALNASVLAYPIHHSSCVPMAATVSRKRGFETISHGTGSSRFRRFGAWVCDVFSHQASPRHSSSSVSVSSFFLFSIFNFKVLYTPPQTGVSHE